MLRPRQMTLILLALALAACGPRPAPPPPVSPGPTAAPLAALEGTKWTLASLEGDAPAGGSTVTMEFYPDSYMQGEAGCNSYGDNYVVDGTRLQVPLIHKTSDKCDAADVMKL